MLKSSKGSTYATWLNVSYEFIRVNFKVLVFLLSCCNKTFFTVNSLLTAFVKSSNHCWPIFHEIFGKHYFRINYMTS